MEKAVVATRLACDGIEVEHNKNILIADTPESFAQCVIELLKNPELRNRLGKNGREMAIRKYTWTYVASLFDNVYRKMCLPSPSSLTQEERVKIVV